MSDKPEEQNPQTSAAAATPAVAKPARAPKHRPIGLFLVIIAAVIFLVYTFFYRSTPDNTVRQYLAARDRNDQAAQQQLLSAGTTRLEMIEQIATPIPRKAANKPLPYTVGVASINEEGKAQVSVSFDVPPEVGIRIGSASGDVVFGLVKEDKKWKIDGPETMKILEERMSNNGG
jgi:hypothetical protein